MVALRPIPLASLTMLALVASVPLAAADLSGYMPALPPLDPDDVGHIEFGSGGGSICVDTPSGCAVCIVYGTPGQSPVYLPGSKGVGTGVAMPKSDASGYGPYYGVWVNAGENCDRGL